MLRDVCGDGCCSNVYLTFNHSRCIITVLGFLKE
jgi:hypothetical protein